MNTLPDARGARPGVDRLQDASAPRHLVPVPEGLVPAPSRPWRERTATLANRMRYPLAVYAGSRVLYLLIALVDTVVRTGANGQSWSLGRELSNWDGVWYTAVAQFGYSHHVSHAQTTLGFFPLDSILIWLVAHVLFCGYVAAGVLVALVTGAIATVLIGRLAERWWGPAASRRVILFFCLFPGTIVFSMVYTEGLLLALVAGCLLALEDRRWLTAGALAGFATAVEPTALAIVPACAAVAAIELRRHGWRDREARRSLLAPLLAPFGIVGLGVFMWIWTGNPLATFAAQRYGWHETTTPLALYRVARSLIQEIFGLDGAPHVNLNLIAAMLGAAFLIWGLVLLWKGRRRVPAAALVWTACVAFLAATSNATPPNPRILIIAFPAVMVVAARLEGKAFIRLVASSSVLLVAMSILTFVSTSLRP